MQQGQRREGQEDRDEWNPEEGTRVRAQRCQRQSRRGHPGRRTRHASDTAAEFRAGVGHREAEVPPEADVPRRERRSRNARQLEQAEVNEDFHDYGTGAGSSLRAQPSMSG